MDFDDLIRQMAAPPKRVSMHDRDHEQHFDEGAVMVAYAMHLLRTEDVTEARIHPDGEHGKRFDFKRWLRRQSFKMVQPSGKTSYGGIYERADGRRIVVNPKSGLKDVVAEEKGISISAERKGGIINTRAPGPKSRLDRGLCEVVGRLMASPWEGRQVAVVPSTAQTEKLARRLAPRCEKAGIAISLVKSRGEVIDIC